MFNQNQKQEQKIEGEENLRKCLDTSINLIWR